MSERPATDIHRTPLPEQADRLSGLFEAHADRLYRLARRLVPSADDALDLVQETFLRAARSPDSVPRGLKDQEAWLVRVLVNIRRDQWRREAVRKLHTDDSSHEPVHRDDEERSLVIRASVWRALDQLTPRRRAVVVMRELEGLSISSIAAQLGVSAVTVRWHLSRGRRELSRRLRIQLGETDEHSEDSLAEVGPAPSRSPAP